MRCRCTAALSVAAALHTARRGIANEYKELLPVHAQHNKKDNDHSNNDDGSHAAPPAHPPEVPHNEPVLPMDFNPHIEWYEFPKEVFEPIYPYTREEAMRATEEVWESSMDEMASRYGVRLNPPPLIYFWLAWLTSVLFGWFFLWSCYATCGAEAHWEEWHNIVHNQPNVPTLEEDDIYLDQWMRPEARQQHSLYDDLWNWKPLVARNGAKTSWSLPHHVPDESEWRHMVSKN